MTIRLRLTLWYGGVLVLVLLTVGGLIWIQLGRSLRGSLDDALQVQVTDVRAGFESDSNVSLAVRDPGRPGIFTVVYDATRVVQRSTAEAPTLPSVPAPGASEQTIDGRQYALYAERSADGSLIVAGAPLAEVDRAVDGLARLLLLVGGAATVAALIVGWWLAGRALAPTGALARELAAIGAGDIGRRVREPVENDEIGRLAKAVNLMLGRIDDGVNRQRAFVTAASHDLRTPIAAMRTELELVPRGQRTAGELTEVVERVHGDVIRLGNLANDLLSLAEAEPGGRDVLRQKVAVDRLVEECVSDQQAIAAAHGVRVAVAAPALSAFIDRSRIEQAIRNLVANAIRYAPRGSTVQVEAIVQPAGPVDDTGRTLAVSVLDRGPGVDADLRSRLFLPFAARSGHDHSGLGLATAAAAVRAHGGTISYEDRAGGGACFRFSVPA